MCKVGDIILIKMYKSHNMDLKQHSFVERDLSREDYTENTLYEFNRCCPNKGIKKMKAAALISQSRRWLNRRVKRLL